MQDNWASVRGEIGWLIYPARPRGCELMRLRSFEYLAATEQFSLTPVPGKDSFTRALIYALESLVKKRADGRFTTLELLRKIKTDAPHFPKEQSPMLIDRERKKHSAGRIMLHPLRTEGSDNEIFRREAASLDPFKGHTLTLQFDFSEIPSQPYIENFGRELNDFFHRNVGINRVRWGGVRPSVAARAAKSFSKSLRQRRASTRLQQSSPSDDLSHSRVPENAQDPLTPSSLGQHSPQPAELASKGNLESKYEGEGHVQDHRKRRKRRRTAMDSESPC